MPLLIHVETQLLLLRLYGGRVAAVLPLTTEQYVGALRGSTHSANGVTVTFQQDAIPAIPYMEARVVVAFGDTAWNAIRDVVRATKRTSCPDVSFSAPPLEHHIFSYSLS